ADARHAADAQACRGSHRPDERAEDSGALCIQLFQSQPDPRGGSQDRRPGGDRAREYPWRPGGRDLLRRHEYLDFHPRSGLRRRRRLMLDQLVHSLWLAPLVACMVIVAIHSYLGLHVIAREVIFVDLSLAQMAALGSTIAIFAGADPDSTRSFAYALAFTTLGAALFALTRTGNHGRVPQEAIIGIVFVVASAAGILVADRSPRGGEAIKDILVGSLLWVGWPAIGRLAVVYFFVGLFHWILRQRFLTISFEPEIALAKGWNLKLWDFLFYLSFGLVITFSVPICG